MDPGDGTCDESTGECTLRAAIMEANAGQGWAIIEFDSTMVNSAITLTDSLPAIVDRVDIRGPMDSSGFPTVTIDGSAVVGDRVGLIVAAPRTTVSGVALGGFARDGIWIEASAVEITSVFVGADHQGGALGNGGVGIRIRGSENRIGTAGEATATTLIANNGSHGVLVEGGSGNTIQTVTFSANSGRPIALGETRPDNDAGDVDDGPNGLINYPTISEWSAFGGQAVVAGSVSGAPASTFSVRFHSAGDCSMIDGAGIAGEVVVSTDGKGRGDFLDVLEADGVRGRLYATVTDAAGNTSEFSECREVASTAPISSGLAVGTDAVTSNRYHLTTLPITTSGSIPLSDVLSDMGEPGPHSWRGFAWRAPDWVEDPVVRAGEAVLLTTARERTLTLRGNALPTPRGIRLQPLQWIAIGLPPGHVFEDFMIRGSAGIVRFGAVEADAMIAPIVRWYADPTADDVPDDTWPFAEPSVGSWQTADGARATTDANPWGGYLVYPREDCTLIVPGSPGPPREAAATQPPAATDWAATIVLSDGQHRSAVDCGAWRESRARPRLPLVAGPPTIASIATIRVVSDSVSLVRDWRPSASSLRWRLEARGPSGARSLTWDASSFPQDRFAYLTDRKRQRTIDLRTEGSYAFRQSEEPREFELMVSSTPWAGDLYSTGSVRLAVGSVNPSPGHFELTFEVVAVERVRLVVFDVAGRLVETLTDAIMEPGVYTQTWDARGRGVGMGVCFARLTSGRTTRSQKLVVLR